jgi:hypothetical protein
MSSTKKFSYTDPNTMVGSLVLTAPEIKVAKRDAGIKYGTLNAQSSRKTASGDTTYEDGYVFEGPAMKTVHGIKLKNKNNKTTYYSLLRIDPAVAEQKQWRMIMRHVLVYIGRILSQYRDNPQAAANFKKMPIMEKANGKFVRTLDTFEDVAKIVQPLVMEFDKDSNPVPLESECFQYAVIKNYEWQGKTVRAPLLFSMPANKYVQFNQNTMPELIKGLTPQTSKNNKNNSDMLVFNIPWERVNNCAITYQPLFELERLHFKPESNDLMLPKFQIISMTLLKVEKINMTSAQTEALESAADNSDDILAGFSACASSSAESTPPVTNVPSIPAGITLPPSNGGGVNTVATGSDLDAKFNAMKTGNAVGGDLSSIMTAPMPKLP